MAHYDPPPAVSIIMPAYNTAQYIGEALESVFSQTFDDYEVIVVNDGSPDGEALERALEPYLERIVYIKQKNRGLSGARNTALRAARAPLVALLDSDDVWEPDYLAFQVATMRGDPTIDVLYPNAWIFGEGPEAGHEFMELCPSEGEVTVESLLTQRCTVMVSVTARRDSLIRAGMFDESLKASEDFDLWLRVLKQGGRIRYHRSPLVRYRRRPTSLSADPVKMCRHILRVLDKTERSGLLTSNEAMVLKVERDRFKAVLRFCEGKTSFLSADFPAAIQAWLEANIFLQSRKIALAILLMRFAPRLVLNTYRLWRVLALGAG